MYEYIISMTYQGPCLEHCYGYNKINLLIITLLSINIGYFICKLRVKNLIKKNKNKII